MSDTLGMGKSWNDNIEPKGTNSGQQLKSIALKANKLPKKKWAGLTQRQRDIFLESVERYARLAIDFDAMNVRAENGLFDYTEVFDVDNIAHEGFSPPSAKTISKLSVFREIIKECAKEGFKLRVVPFSDDENETKINLIISWKKTKVTTDPYVWNEPTGGNNEQL